MTIRSDNDNEYNKFKKEMVKRISLNDNEPFDETNIDKLIIFLDKKEENN